MKCTINEQEKCDVEKLGCEGCYYNENGKTHVINLCEGCVFYDKEIKKYIKDEYKIELVTLSKVRKILNDEIVAHRFMANNDWDNESVVKDLYIANILEDILKKIES